MRHGTCDKVSSFLLKRLSAMCLSLPQPPPPPPLPPQNFQYLVNVNNGKNAAISIKSTASTAHTLFTTCEGINLTSEFFRLGLAGLLAAPPWISFSSSSSVSSNVKLNLKHAIYSRRALSHNPIISHEDLAPKNIIFKVYMCFLLSVVFVSSRASLN